MRLKLEINTTEHFHVLPYSAFPFEVASKWFSGKADITTYSINELLGTKLRALYQRKKGRDLFDLFYANQGAAIDGDEIVKCYWTYMLFVVKKCPTQKQFLMNLDEKVNDANFSGDIEGLLRQGITYDAHQATKWVKEELITKLD